jgi:hypothetical protein
VIRWAVCGALVAFTGCSEPQSSDVGPPVDTIALPRIAMSAKRPAKRFFVERTSDRCSVYFEEGGQRSPSEDVPCVQDLLLGERIRLLGSTCVREASSENRSIPVMCPNELSRFVSQTNKASASASAVSDASAAPRPSPK